MEVLHNGKYPDKNMIACDECNCIFRYYDSEVLIETSSLEEQEVFCGYGVTKYIKCPQCGYKNIQQLRRVTGYLSADYRQFNAGKQAEVKERVKHSKYTKFGEE